MALRNKRSSFFGYLEELRELAGLTLLQAAEEIGVHEKTIRSWELGNAVPLPSLLLPIAMTYNVGLTQLMKRYALASKSQEYARYIELKKALPALNQEMSFGECFKTARRRLGLTIGELAAALDVTRVSIMSWEKGVYLPSREKLPLIAQKLNIPLPVLNKIYKREDAENKKAAIRLASTKLTRRGRPPKEKVVGYENTWGGILKAARERMGKSQSALAQEAGVRVADISRWENNRTIIDRHYEKLVSLLDLTKEERDRLLVLRPEATRPGRSKPRRKRPGPKPE